MFRVQPYVENTKYIKFNLETSIKLPGNNESQEKDRYRFNITDRNNFYDWYNAYFRVDFKFEAKADGANIATDTASAPINGSFSLIRTLEVKSGKILYKANNIHKIIFIKNLLDFSDDYSRSVAKNQFWYLDNDETKDADANETNLEGKSASITKWTNGSDNYSIEQILLF